MRNSPGFTGSIKYLFNMLKIDLTPKGGLVISTLWGELKKNMACMFTHQLSALPGLSALSLSVVSNKRESAREP